MDPLSHITPASHTIVYQRSPGCSPTAPKEKVRWGIAIQNKYGEIETSKCALLWEHAEHFMLRWREQFGLRIVEVGDTPDYYVPGI